MSKISEYFTNLIELLNDYYLQVGGDVSGSFVNESWKEEENRGEGGVGGGEEEAKRGQGTRRALTRVARLVVIARWEQNGAEVHGVQDAFKRLFVLSC